MPCFTSSRRLGETRHAKGLTPRPTELDRRVNVAAQVNLGAFGNGVRWFVGEDDPMVFPHVHHCQSHRFVRAVVGPVVVAPDQHSLLQSGLEFVLQPALKIGPCTVGRAVEQVSQQDQGLGLHRAQQVGEHAQGLKIHRGWNGQPLGTEVLRFGQVQIAHHEH